MTMTGFWDWVALWAVVAGGYAVPFVVLFGLVHAAAS